MGLWLDLPIQPADHVHNTNWDNFFLNGKDLKLKKYSSLFSLTSISNGCTTTDLQVLLRRQMSFWSWQDSGKGFASTNFGLLHLLWSSLLP